MEFSKHIAEESVKNFQEVMERSSGSGGAARTLESVDTPQDRRKYVELVGELTAAHFPSALDTLISTDAEGETLESIQSGGSQNVGRYVIRAFQKRLCGNATVSKGLRKALKDAKAQGVQVVNPTANQLSMATATAISLIIATTFAGPIAVAVAPLIGGVTLLIMLCGFDVFCAWAADSI